MNMNWTDPFPTMADVKAILVQNLFLFVQSAFICTPYGDSSWPTEIEKLSTSQSYVVKKYTFGDNFDLSGGLFILLVTSEFLDDSKAKIQNSLTLSQLSNLSSFHFRSKGWIYQIRDATANS